MEKVTKKIVSNGLKINLEISALPDGWKIVSINEVVEKTNQADPQKKPNLKFKYIDVSCVSSDTLSIDNYSEYTGDTAPSRARKIIKENDVIFATVRPYLKRVAIVPENLDGEICSTAFCVLRAKTDIIDPDFLYYATIYDPFVLRVSGRQRGSSYPAVTDKDVRNELIPLPPLTEQRNITHVLRTVQHAKESAEKVIVAARTLKQSLMNHLFTYGHVPFEEVGKVELKKTAAGLVPSHWNTVPIGDICDVRNGFAFKSDDYVERGVLNFRVVNIGKDGAIDIKSDVKFLPEQFVDDYAGYMLNTEDILLVMVGATRGKIGFITDTVLPALMNQNMWRIVSQDNNLPQRYIYFYLCNKIDQFAKTYSEESRGFFSKTHFRKFPISFPRENRALFDILTTLEAIERKLHVNQIRSNIFSLLFTTLLYHLMNGQFRVEDSN